LLFFLFFFTIVYPSIGDFDYSHMASAIVSEDMGHVNLSNYTTPGSCIYTVMVSETSAITYDSIPTLPIQSIPLIFLFVVMLRRLMIKRWAWLSLSAVYFTFSTNPDRFTLEIHSLGAVLFLLLVVLTLLRIRARSSGEISANSIVIVLVLISLNFMDYQLTFVALAFLLGLELLRYLQRRVSPTPSTQSAPKFALLVLLGAIFVLDWNQFFYHTFIPTIQLSSEYSSSSGLQKIFNAFSHSASDPLSDYYRRNPSLLLFSLVIWQAIIFTALLYFLIRTSRKPRVRQQLSAPERTVLALGFSGILLLLVYELIGSAAYEFMTIAGVAGIGVLHQSGGIRLQKILGASIVILVVLNLTINAMVVSTGYYQGQKDFSHFESLDATAEWCVEQKNGVVVVSDVMTNSFLLKTIAAEKATGFQVPGTLSRDQIMMILGLDDNTSMLLENSDYHFLINYKEQHYTILGWDTFNSWSPERGRIANDYHFDVIYTTYNEDMLIVEPL
jgi:hypothetical protein